MKNVLISWLLLSLFSPFCVYAANFSQTFVGYANNVPIKLKLTNVDSQLRGTYAYTNNFKTSYVPDANFIFGQKNDNTITLNTNKGNMNNVHFQGNLVSKTQNGQSIYILQGQWQDKMRLINQTVELHQLVFNPGSKNPIINQFKADKDPTHFYTTEASYPLFTGINLTANQIAINEKIKAFVDDKISSFIQSVKQANEEEKNKNLTPDAFQFFIDNSVTNSQGILSIRFALFQSMYHAAHPYTNYMSLNFDTETGKSIALADLFKPNSNYLEALAKIVRPELIKKLYPNLKPSDYSKNFDVKWIYEGTKPVMKNYQVWNIYKNNLMITFPAYQVAAYVYGEQTILIPLAKLVKIIKTNSFLAQVTQRSEISFY